MSLIKQWSCIGNGKKHYYGIDWIRVIACAGIVLMHMISKVNNSYVLTGFLAERVIPSFTNFTFLFMSVSAFGMCVGYYEKVLSSKVNWIDFYKKRYLKVLTFFSVVVLIDIIFNHNLNSLIEAIPNLTLTRGLFPNNIGQIGVAWFLGLVFVFYMIFPFFCTLLASKKSAWITLVISVLLNFIVGTYYGVERENIIYSMMFFVVGGLIFLYRDKLEGKNLLFVPIMLASIVFYYLFEGVYACFLVSAVFLMAAISINPKKNRVVSFLSELSMEVFLCHMVVFRAIEKMHLNTIIGNGWIQYILTCVLVLGGAVCLALFIKRLINSIFLKFE